MNPPVKLVISGPVGAGKTTFIQTLSDSPVVSTDEEASEDIGKTMTTVAMDFGTLTVEDYPIYLFGTPGQERFDFMWEVLCEGAYGLILLIAGDRPKDFPQARRILEFITTQTPIPFIIAVTRQDMPMVWSPEEVSEYFGVDPNLACGLDARDQQSSYETLFRMFALINEQAAN
ncbi:MAG: ATP/GTP-binding protein [Candidatus Methylacidiphilales bacterium]|nr:ATP/GTP-binding protein [Candidatus Methylacidiphilales bacterium]